MQKLTWSYSALQMFLQCPHKYYRLRIKKDVKQEDNAVLRYGNEVHKSCELYIRDGVDLPPAHEFLRPTLDRLEAMAGEKHCELKLGLTEDLEPCGFFDKDVWFRGIVDLLIINGDKARVIDYKTGKSARYADVGQLELMSLAVFKHYPQVKSIKSGLLFVVSNEFVKADYKQAEAGVKWGRWIRDVGRIQKSIENNVWNKIPNNFTCYGCPVTDCEFWKPSRYR